MEPSPFFCFPFFFRQFFRQPSEPQAPLQRHVAGASSRTTSCPCPRLATGGPAHASEPAAADLGSEPPASRRRLGLEAVPVVAGGPALAGAGPRSVDAGPGRRARSPWLGAGAGSHARTPWLGAGAGFRKNSSRSAARGSPYLGSAKSERPRTAPASDRSAGRQRSTAAMAIVASEKFSTVRLTNVASARASANPL